MAPAGGKKIRYITLPLLKPTVILLTLLAMGGIFYGDFGMIYAIVGRNVIALSDDGRHRYVRIPRAYGFGRYGHGGRRRRVPISGRFHSCHVRQSAGPQVQPGFGALLDDKKAGVE